MDIKTERSDGQIPDNSALVLKKAFESEWAHMLGEVPAIQAQQAEST